MIYFTADHHFDHQNIIKYCELLTHAGKVSHENAVRKAELEYDKYRTNQDLLSQPVDQDFEQAARQIEKLKRTSLPSAKPKAGKKKCT